MRLREEVHLRTADSMRLRATEVKRWRALSQDDRGSADPVVVFASGRDAARRKRVALARGALAYSFRWEGLFREIDRVFSDARETG